MRKVVVMILTLILVCSIGLTLAGCVNHNTRYQIVFDVIDPTTEEPMVNSYIEEKAEDFAGIEIKYRLKGEEKYLPNKEISLAWLKSMTKYYLYIEDDSLPITNYEIINDEWPTKVGKYRVRIDFNFNYRNGHTGEKFNSSPNFSVYSKFFRLVIL